MKSSKERLEDWADKALNQINERRYTARVCGNGYLKWGIACSGKNVAARCEREQPLSINPMS